MKSITTDQVTNKQNLIEQKFKLLLDRYPSMWFDLISDWKADDQADAGWLLYSANYLFRTGGVRWAIDPLSLQWRIPAAPFVDVGQGLNGLSVILLTHEHKDHLDLNLIRELKNLPISWVIPKFMVEKIQKETQLSSEQIVIPSVLKPIIVQGLTILPFEGQHFISYSDGTVKGVPEMGYMVEQSGRRWLFPGDTRVYDVSRFPKLGSVDLLFAHLWLGHGSAMREPNGMLEAYCQFCSELQPKKVVITHLEEFGRKADNFFDEEHAQKIKQVFSMKYPTIDCSSLHIGDKFLL